MSPINSPQPTDPLPSLLDEIALCRLCAEVLPHPPRPVVIADRRARILIAGQAPGRKVHESGIPWNDASGRRLREWLDVTPGQFYDPALFAIVPMGFCYPGKGRAGDLPPRPECRRTWHPRLLPALANIQLTLVIGQYARDYHLPQHRSETLSETVATWRTMAPAVFPLPHPSPRNQRWLAQHPWFAADLLPALRAEVRRILRQG
ncbi:uracil-DNA glycosylase family protein [Paludibacterium purpuratum]|uniref:Uracil-DNA glycosylase n=1 Tax=Paludibacterium purpuratum TaxID=1144873 RepID=A0A4R7BCG5_9NEIS|nr:uracil-DNA glycosylase family protein [Paludibacterium purpuratum]TDR82760.1 uracil-DNA glycosylase [Paludibacterium purpuratum]